MFNLLELKMCKTVSYLDIEISNCVITSEFLSHFVPSCRYNSDNWIIADTDISVCLLVSLSCN